MTNAGRSDPTVLKLAIDSKYSQEATASKSSSSCCCGSDRSEVPSDAQSVSLGCGSPVSYVSFREGMTLVDLGCGGGIDVFAAADKLRPLNGKAIGIDSTIKMIARARRTASQNNYTNVEFRLGEIENLPIEKETVDVVTSNCVINLVPDKLRAFQEIYRVLKQGGSMTISDIIAKKPVPDRIKKDPEKWSECVSGALSIEELKALLLESGFIDFKILEDSKWDKTEDQDLELASVTFYALKPKGS